MAVYSEMDCSVACNKLKRNVPFAWGLNIYRGCEHGCKYCYAIYTHDYLNAGSEKYSEDIYVKTNIVEQLEMQLSSPSWKREVVNIGGVTDSYQPAEVIYKLMPDILRVMIKYKPLALFLRNRRNHSPANRTWRRPVVTTICHAKRIFEDECFYGSSLHADYPVFNG